MKIPAVLTLLLAVAAVSMAAEPIVIGRTESVDSKILAEKRTIFVHLPASYERSPESRYPVAYVLDAETRFQHTAATADALAGIGHVPEMIVVAVTNTDRTRDLTPPWTRPDPPEQWAAVLPAAGGADNFLGFLEQELIPHVEKSLRTAPYRILIGHSFGGLFALHALATKPDLFHAVIAISPTLQWNGDETFERTRALFAGRGELSRRLYVTLGDEGGESQDSFKRFAQLLTHRAPAGLAWEARIFPAEDHGSVPIVSVHHGFESIFAGWRLPGFVALEGLAAVDDHYRRLSGELGYAVATPEAVVNNLGYLALARGDTAEAIRLFEENVRRYPASPNVYDSLGEATEAAGDLQQARELYRRAAKMGREVQDPNQAFYERHLEAVTEKLREGG